MVIVIKPRLPKRRGNLKGIQLTQLQLYRRPARQSREPQAILLR